MSWLQPKVSEFGFRIELCVGKVKVRDELHRAKVKTKVFVQ